MEYFPNINSAALSLSVIIYDFCNTIFPPANSPCRDFLLFATVLAIKTQLGDRGQSDLTGTVVDCGP